MLRLQQPREQVSAGNLWALPRHLERVVRGALEGPTFFSCDPAGPTLTQR